MEIILDQHVHTDFSSDCEVPMEHMITKAIELGFSKICFTDHMDYQFPAEKYHMNFEFSAEDYFRKINLLRRNFPAFIIRAGVELGLKDDVLEPCNLLTSQYPFDLVIGSTHLVDNIDPYYTEYWESVGEENGIRRYYEVTYENVCHSFDFDVYGHIDYIIRYCPTITKSRKNGQINESFYLAMIQNNQELLDAIFTKLIDTNRGIELNTGGLKYKLGHPNPHETILKRYHKLGGKLLTIGSDAHETKYLGYCFSNIPKLLHDCGFTAYYEYENRTPIPIPLRNH